LIKGIDPSIDVKQLVRAGYDSCAEVYAAARCEDDADQLAPLLEVVPDGSSVLDLGCGAGIPIAQTLSERYAVTGVDTSEAMLRLAKRNVPDAQFLHGDILDAELKENFFDAVVAIFVLFHLPQDEHVRVFERVYSRLRPGGYFLVTLTKDSSAPHIKHDFFGTDMYWSKLGFSEYIDLLKGVGFEIVRERIVGHGYVSTSVGKDEHNPMTLVRRPD
jgi:SAM-dependent methyltransferase